MRRPVRWVAALACAIAASFPQERAWAAGAAYQVDTAEVSEPGSCKVESWASAGSNRDFILATTPACVVNLYRAFELSAQIARSRSDGEWGTSISPKIKTNLIPSAIGRFGVAFTAIAQLDPSTREVSAWFVTLPATLRVSNVVRINLNLGYQRDRVSARDYLTYGAGVDWRTPDNVWTLTGEVFGQMGSLPEDTARTVTQPRWQAGLRWRPVDEFNMDLIYGRNLTGENANWLTLATVYRFKVGQNGEKK